MATNTESQEVQDLFDRIAARRPRVLRRVAFRSAGTRYANETDLLSGVGAGNYGGRWNPRGLPAIYVSLDPVTAVKEAYQEFSEAGFQAKTIRPRVFAGLSIRLKQVLDLTDRQVRRALGFTLEDLITEDWAAIQDAGQESWTQAIGRGAARARFEGLLVPSARNRHGANVVIFPQNLRSGSRVDAMAGADLPPHPSEWPV